MGRGKVTALDVWQRADAAIARREPVVKAFLHYDRSGSRAAAASPAAGPLGGAPLVVKDLADVCGMPTTGGSRAYRRHPRRDAAVVGRWRDAGAVLLGKTNTEELAFGVITAPTTNPWDPARIPGGSSGGTAAALAAGMALGGLGTDTAGSIRIPAALCGVVGFKPTAGLLPLGGVMALAPSFDAVGPLAHSVDDAAALFHAMGGPAAAGAAARPRPPRIGLPDRYWSGRLDAEVSAAWQQALGVMERAGAQLSPLPWAPWARWRDIFLAIRRPESFWVHRRMLASERRRLLRPGLAERLEEGGAVSAVDYIAAQAERASLIRAYRRRLGPLVVAMPTVGVVAPRAGEERLALPQGSTSVWEALVALTMPASVLGFPAVTVPMGWSRDRRLPIGLQIMGAPGRDLEVLAVARWWVQHASPRSLPSQ